MLTEIESHALADLLFPDVTETPESLKKSFPTRVAKVVTRFAPSPTGFMHIGNIASSLVAERIAHLNNGVFFLRIEDTDQKREIENGVANIIARLEKFDISIDEGPIGPNGVDIGAYGPYTQSKRVAYYHAFAKDFIRKWLAYPCFLTETEITDIRDLQMSIGKVPGVYGSYSPWSREEFETIKKRIEAGDSYTIRYRSHGFLTARVTVEDEIRGKIEMQDNFLDVPLLKTNGIPTYHFAHVVDDYLMGTTHVIRGEDWLPSLPLHVQLFGAAGITPPKYAHVSLLLKMEDGNKRKLSKRKDPEADINYFFKEGYLPLSVKEYLLNIDDSSYEDWKKANPEKSMYDFKLEFSAMPKSGALFDLKKLESISHAYLSTLDNDTLFNAMLNWAETYDSEFFALMKKYEDVAKQAVSIQRFTEKDPKKFRKLSDVREYLKPFIPELFAELVAERPNIELPLEKALCKEILADSFTSPELLADPEVWLEAMRSNWTKYKIARDSAEWKAGGYVGKFGDYAMVLRLAIAGCKTSPDLYETIKILGAEEVERRVKEFVETMNR